MRPLLKGSGRGGRSMGWTELRILDPKNGKKCFKVENQERAPMSRRKYPIFKV